VLSAHHSSGGRTHSSVGASHSRDCGGCAGLSKAECSTASTMKRIFGRIASLIYSSPRNRDKEMKVVAEPPNVAHTYSDDNIYPLAKRRKLDREEDGNQTPCLISHDRGDPDSLCSSKRMRRREEKDSGLISVKQNVLGNELGRQLRPSQVQSRLFRRVPTEVIGYCLSFLCTREDRLSLQCTCRHFREMSDNDDILRKIRLSESSTTGKGGFISYFDTRESAQLRLEKFVFAGNLEAYYMMGMIRAYCFDDVAGGIYMLRLASCRGDVRSSYVLGLILRDTHKGESAEMLNNAASGGFLPALQEILPAREMKAHHGEPTADELGKYLDPICLSKLLSRHYANDPLLREKHTSHCWNPSCGRWAYKQATSGGSSRLSSLGDHLYGRYNQQSSDDARILASNINGSRFSSARNLSDKARSAKIGLKNKPVNIVQHSPLCAAYCPMTCSMNCVQPRSRNNILWGQNFQHSEKPKVSRMKMCSSCRRAKYCSKLCQVYDWRSGRHKLECEHL